MFSNTILQLPNKHRDTAPERIPPVSSIKLNMKTLECFTAADRWRDDTCRTKRRSRWTLVRRLTAPAPPTGSETSCKRCKASCSSPDSDRDHERLAAMVFAHKRKRRSHTQVIANTLEPHPHATRVHGLVRKRDMTPCINAGAANDKLLNLPACM
jgi:hypothetical protein